MLLNLCRCLDYIFYPLIILKSAAGKLPKRITVMPDSHIITRQVYFKLTIYKYQPVNLNSTTSGINSFSKISWNRVYIRFFQDQQDDITRPWRCEPCGYSTSIASNLRIHLSSEKHAQAVRKLDAVFLCGICTKFTSETAEQLEQHVSRWRHVEEDFGLQQQADFYVCNLCNYQTQVNFG